MGVYRRSKLLVKSICEGQIWAGPVTAGLSEFFCHPRGWLRSPSPRILYHTRPELAMVDNILARRADVATGSLTIERIPAIALTPDLRQAAAFYQARIT